MLYHAAGMAEPGVDIEQVVMTLQEPLDEALFLRAWERLVERHAILRTRFKWPGTGEPRQEVLDRVRIPVERFDSPSLERVVDEHRARGFDVTQAPLMRLALARRGDDHTVLWTFHHLLLDGRSRFMLIRELFACYEALAAGGEVAREAPRPYRDYIEWLRRLDHERARDYWQRALAGFRAPTPLGVAGRHGAAGYATQECRLPAKLTSALRKRARAARITLSVLLQGAWALLLHRYSGERDVVFGVTRAGRSSALEGAAGMIGLLINTVPLRLHVDPEAELLTWLAGLRRPLLELREHEHTPLVQVQAWSELPRGTPLFESLFVFAEHTLDAELRAQGGKWSARHFRTHAQSNYPLALAAYGDEQLVLQLQYSRRRFADDVMRRLSGHLQALLEGMTSDPHARLHDLPLLTAHERHRLLVGWNATALAHPQARCAHELVEEQARVRPDVLAVEDGERQLTYRELDERAERLASRLRRHGMQPDSLAAVYLERSVEMVIALLAIWKAGGAYVPIDREYPAERVRFMLEDSGAPVVLTQKALAAELPALPAKIVHVDVEEFDGQADRARAPPCAERLAYVIYTSGSTGVPKGVPITHRSLFNLICWHRDAYEVTPADRATQVAGPAFDATVWEIWPYLAAGASVHIADERTRLDAQRLVRWLAERRITLAFLPTPLAEVALRERWPETSCLRVLLTGGDKLGPPPARRLPFRLVNHYGPAENTVVSTCGDVPPNGTPAIGRPLPNTWAYVVDHYLQPVPIGVPGELLVGGVQLSSGYWRRPELNAERFIQAFGRRLYRTGDRVRWLEDGNIEFLGRLDDQVKIRGCRVELGEIEAAIARHPGVREVVVMARDIAADKRLVAYVVARSDPEELRGALRAKLPSYMVPAHFVKLDALPLTQHGKIDRKALPVPERIAAAAADYLAPSTSTERALAELWQSLLGIERVGARDNFFESGGHSLLAMQLIGGVRKRFGVELTIKNLFELPVLADLAEAIDARSWLARSNVAAFLNELVRREIRVSAEGERLRCSAPAGALTPALREELARREAEILEFLRKAEAIAPQPDGIVPMQPRGTRMPIYAVSGHNGDVFAFRDLVRQLGEDQPFYGLQAPGLDGRSEPLARVEDIAAYLAAQIRTFQPAGSFVIAGYCAGGSVALELARQLASAGAEPALLALFGCAHPTVYRFSLRYWLERVALHAGIAARLPSFRARWGYLAERWRARLWQLRADGTPRGNDPNSLARFRFEQAMLLAVRRYTPGPYAGRVCHFIPRRGWLPDNGGAARWRSAAPRTEDYYGPDNIDPGRMLLDPGAAVFAELFERCRDSPRPIVSVSTDHLPARWAPPQRASQTPR